MATENAAQHRSTIQRALRQGLYRPQSGARNRWQEAFKGIYARAMATRLSVPPRKRPQPVRDTVLYLYGVTLPDKKNGAGVSISAVGIDGAAQVESDHVAGLVCWFSRVSKREFGDKLAENMENLDWLSVAGVRHQKTVSEIARLATIIPAVFGTNFRTLALFAAGIKRPKCALLRD